MGLAGQFSHCVSLGQLGAATRSRYLFYFWGGLGQGRIGWFALYASQVRKMTVVQPDHHPLGLGGWHDPHPVSRHCV
jgi:hypothetical protein